MLTSLLYRYKVPLDCVHRETMHRMLFIMRLGVASAFAVHNTASAPRLPSSCRVTMALPLGARLSEEAVKEMGISGRRAAIFFVNSESEDEAMLAAAVGQTSSFETFECMTIAVPQGKDVGVKQPTLTMLPCDPQFVQDGKTTSLTQQFAVQPYVTMQGPAPGRESFVIDSAGYVRGSHVDQKDGASHVAAALQSLAKLETSPKMLDVEKAFKDEALVTEDGDTQRPTRLSAVGRLREEEARARAARGDKPGWDTALAKKLNEMVPFWSGPGS